MKQNFTFIFALDLTTVTYAHHSLIQGNRAGVLYGLIATLVLAVIFTILQGVEYSVSSFTISDGAFGSCFYFGTGFHGLMGSPFQTYYNKYSVKAKKLVVVGLSPYWLTGFADAESCFRLIIHKDNKRKHGWRIRLEFSIELHIKDLALLYQGFNLFGGNRENSYT